MTDILAGNTNPNVNPFWGKFAIRGPDGRRPATLKTGTNNDAKDLNAYGYIAPPTEEGRADGAYALAVGVWNGNSDNSPVSTAARPGLLDRRLDLRLAGLPQGGQPQVAGDPLRSGRRRPRPRTRSTRGPGCRRAAAASPSTSGSSRAPSPRTRSPRTPAASTSWCGAGRRRDQLRRTGWRPTATGSGAPNVVRAPPAARTGRATAYFYNGGVPAVRLVVGRGRRRRDAASPSPSPSCFPIPTPGRRAA